MSPRTRAAAVLVSALAVVGVPVTTAATAAAAQPTTTYVDFADDVRVIPAGAV